RGWSRCASSSSPSRERRRRPDRHGAGPLAPRRRPRTDMANLIDIRRRIRSVKNTQQITKAMKMISAARLRRAQDRILAARPYAQEIKKVIGNLAARGERLHHPLLEKRPENKVLLAVVTGDKGLAGAFNANVLRRSNQAVAKLPSVELLLLGRKGADFFRRRSYPIRNSYTTLFTNVQYAQAQEIAADLIRANTEKQLDSVHVVYNQFKSLMSQELTEEVLLPVPTTTAEGGEAGAREYLFEPSAESILE